MEMSAVVANLPAVPVLGLMDLTRADLFRIAVARGCRHYAPLLGPGTAPDDVPGLPHEMLGAALLRGAPDTATFQAIRCGAMVLSDLGNSPQRIGEVSEQFGVAGRVAHLARLGLEADQHPGFWSAVLKALPPALDDDPFLPGVSRFTSETRLAGTGQPPVRVWLRTHYGR